MKKIFTLSAILVSSLGFAQPGGPLPEYVGNNNFNMGPNSMTPPGAFTGQPQMMVGEQPSYVQAGAQNCYDRNHRSSIVGPIQSNGQPVPMPGSNMHGM